MNLCNPCLSVAKTPYPKISRTLSTKPLLSRSLFSTSANCSSKRRCSLVNVVGVITVTDTKRSPRPRPPRTGIPLPLSRNTVPVCVPNGTLSFSSSSSVLTIISAPSAACAKVIGTASYRLLPCRSNCSCSATWITTYRSPDAPPCTPASPSPDTRKREPVSTPAGIFTSNCFSRSTRPEPLQSGQGFLITRPAPRQTWHVLATEKNPCWYRT